MKEFRKHENYLNKSIIKDYAKAQSEAFSQQVKSSHFQWANEEHAEETNNNGYNLLFSIILRTFLQMHLQKD